MIEPRDDIKMDKKEEMEPLRTLKSSSESSETLKRVVS